MGQTLVIHPGALGDVLLAVPALRALRRVDLGGERRGAPPPVVILAAQSHVGELLHMLDEVSVRVRFDLLGLDALFVAGGPVESLKLLGAADRVVSWFGSRDPVFIRRLREIAPSSVVAPSTARDVPVWEHLMTTVGADPVDADRAPVTVPRRLVEDGRTALEKAGWDGARPLLLVHPGASGALKRWSVDGFAAVLAATQAHRQMTVMVHEGPADAEPARALCDRLPAGTLHLDNPSLTVLAGALCHVAAWVGNDSGVSHLATAVGVPSVVLFTSGALGWTPWARAVEAFVVSTASFHREDVDAVAATLARVLARIATAGMGDRERPPIPPRRSEPARGTRPGPRGTDAFAGLEGG